MQPYLERAAQVACASQIAIQVFLSSDNGDIEMVPLRPVPARLSTRISEEDFTARQLRHVGVIGLCGLDSRCAFEEPLEPQIVTAIAMAFSVYAQTLMGGRMADAAEVAELERLYALPDTRLN